jgi:hypothetical protein
MVFSARSDSTPRANVALPSSLFVGDKTGGIRTASLHDHVVFVVVAMGESDLAASWPEAAVCGAVAWEEPTNPTTIDQLHERRHAGPVSCFSRSSLHCPYPPQADGSSKDGLNESDRANGAAGDGAAASLDR